MRAARTLVPVGALLLVGFWSGPSYAQLIVPVSQTRTITAETTHPSGDPDSASAEATDFSPFDRSVGAASEGLGPGDVARASASQNSTIGADRIHGSSHTLALFSDFSGQGTAEATSTVDVTFDLTEPSLYSLFGGGDVNSFGGTEITLSGPQGVIHQFSGHGGFGGTLFSGRYRLQVVTFSIQADDAIEGRHSVSFDLCFECTPAPPPKPKYSLSGRFTSHRGALLDVPLVGRVPCPSLTLMSGPGTGMATTPPARTMTRLPNGCVGPAPGVAINQSAVGPKGTFPLPANALRQNAPQTANWVSFPAVPRVQVQTSLAIVGPQKAAALRASAWSKQAGRAGPNFTWCPGDPACTKVGQGERRAIVKYIAGPNRFGGTMQMVITAGTANPSRIVRAFAEDGPVSFLPFPETGPRPTGAGYAFAKTDPAMSGSGFVQHMASSMGRITMGTGYLGPRPGVTAKHYGFPFTTGRVIVRRTGTRSSTLSAVGSDQPTAMGGRQLSLVAGGIAVSQSQGSLDPLLLEIAQISLPEPSSSAQLLAAVSALLVIGIWRARRRR